MNCVDDKAFTWIGDESVFWLPVHMLIDGDYYLSDGDLPGKYKASYIDFRFGDNDRHGSEHTLLGATFPLEVSWQKNNLPFEVSWHEFIISGKLLCKK